MNPIQQLDALPTSAPKTLNLKDYLKGFFITSWAFIVFETPDILAALGAYDFGQYKKVVSILVFALGYLYRRYYKGKNV